MTSFRRFSLLTLVIGVTAASGGLAYLRARLYSQQPYAQRVHGIVRGAIPVEPFRLGLVQRIEDLGYKRCDNAEAQALASYRMVHNDCQGQPEVYRGAFSNGKRFYVHCYLSPKPGQSDQTIYSITVSFFETPYEQWYTREANHTHARNAALALYDTAHSLWAEQWHARQRESNGLPPR